MRLLDFLVFLPLVSSQCLKNWIFDSATNKCYLFAADTFHFDDAESECNFQGGHLASIPNAFVASFINQNADVYFPDSEFWIGGQLASNGSWTWTDGSNFSYTDWDNGQPNTKNSKYTCLSMDTNTHRWYAADCLYLFPYVCEADPPKYPIDESCCQSGWTFYQPSGNCYRVIRWYDWNTAENACQQVKAELTSIHDSNENNFVAELARASVPFNATGQAWIGLFLAPHAVWEWTDKTDVSYTPFLTGQTIGDPKKSNCALLVADDLTDIPNARLSWIPADCSMKLRTAICKYSPNAH